MCVVLTSTHASAVRPFAGSGSSPTSHTGCAVNAFEFIGELAERWRTFAWIASGVVMLGTALIVAMPTTYTSSTRLLVSIAGSTTFEAYQNDDVAGADQLLHPVADERGRESARRGRTPFIADR